jgi:hypothetical protein
MTGMLNQKLIFSQLAAGAAMLPFLYGFPLVYEWMWIKWRPLFLTFIVYISVIKATVKLKEKQIVLYLVNLLGGDQKNRTGLSGVVDMIFLTVFTFDIDYTVTSYQYSILI